MSVIAESIKWKKERVVMLVVYLFTWHQLGFQPCDQGSKSFQTRTSIFSSTNSTITSANNLALAEAEKLHRTEGFTMPPRIVTREVFGTTTKLWRKSYSTAPRVRLAYDLHEPANPSSNAPGAIIFMHGLFGSKKNNRSISKWAFYVPPRPDNQD
jgi:hypothetical protein